jgi:hypothetical protein
MILRNKGNDYSLRDTLEMESFGPIVAAGFTENYGLIVITVSMGQDSSERAVPQLPSTSITQVHYIIDYWLLPPN